MKAIKSSRNCSPFQNTLFSRCQITNIDHQFSESLSFLTSFSSIKITSVFLNLKSVFLLVKKTYLYSNWLDTQSSRHGIPMPWCKVWRSCKSFFQLSPLKNVKTRALSFLLLFRKKIVLLSTFLLVYRKGKPEKMFRIPCNNDFHLPLTQWVWSQGM